MEDERGVVILKNIPHGFYENQMYKFFSQFGEISRLRLLRSKKTTKSKAIAFIEFIYKDVAKIVAETMNNYLMFEKILKCHLVPKTNLPPRLFRNWKTPVKSTVQAHKKKVFKKASSNWDRLKQEKLANIKKIENKLKEMGIDFHCIIRETSDMPNGSISSSVRHKRLSFARLKRILLFLPKFALLNAIQNPDIF